MKKTLYNFARVRYVLLVLFLLLAFIAWTQREVLYAEIPFDLGVHTTFILDCMVFLALFILFVGLVQELRSPWILRLKVKRAFQRIASNPAERPALISFKCDREKAHEQGIKLKIASKGFTISEMKAQNERIEKELGHVYDFYYGTNKQFIYLLVSTADYIPPVSEADDEEF